MTAQEAIEKIREIVEADNLEADYEKAATRFEAVLKEITLMPIRVVTGPPFSGKDRAVHSAGRIEPSRRCAGRVTSCSTRRCSGRRFRDPGDVERSDADGQLANAMKRKGLDVAVAQERDGWLIVAERDPLRLREVDGRGRGVKGVAGHGTDGDVAGAGAEAWAILRGTSRGVGRQVGRLRGRFRLHGPHGDNGTRTRCELFTTSRRSTGRRWKGVTVREAGSDVQHRCSDGQRRATGRGRRFTRGVGYGRPLRRRGSAWTGFESASHAAR